MASSPLWRPLKQTKSCSDCLHRLECSRYILSALTGQSRLGLSSHRGTIHEGSTAPAGDAKSCLSPAREGPSWESWTTGGIREIGGKRTGKHWAGRGPEHIAVLRSMLGSESCLLRRRGRPLPSQRQPRFSELFEDVEFIPLELHCLWTACLRQGSNCLAHESDVTYGQVWWPILGICALQLTHPKCTHTAVNTHTLWTHTRSSGQPFYAAVPGEQLEVRCLAQGHLICGIEGGESAVHSLPQPTIPVGPRLELPQTALNERSSFCAPRRHRAILRVQPDSWVPAEARTKPLLFLSFGSGWLKRLRFQHYSRAGTLTLVEGDPRAMLKPRLGLPLRLRLRLRLICRLSGGGLLATSSESGENGESRKAIFSTSLILVRFSQRWRSNITKLAIVLPIACAIAFVARRAKSVAVHSSLNASWYCWPDSVWWMVLRAY